MDVVMPGHERHRGTPARPARGSRGEGAHPFDAGRPALRPGGLCGRARAATSSRKRRTPSSSRPCGRWRRQPLPPPGARRPNGGRRGTRAGGAEADPLSDREREVLRLLALGHTNQEIAKLLFISVRTAESHRAHIMQKLRPRDPSRARPLCTRPRAIGRYRGLKPLPGLGLRIARSARRRARAHRPQRSRPARRDRIESSSATSGRSSPRARAGAAGRRARRVGGRLAPVPAHERACLALEHELSRVDVRERRDAEARLADQLREHAAGAEGDERAEDLVLHDARRGARRCRCASAGRARARRSARRPRGPRLASGGRGRRRRVSVLCAPGDARS